MRAPEMASIFGIWGFMNFVSSLLGGPNWTVQFDLSSDQVTGPSYRNKSGYTVICDGVNRTRLSDCRKIRF